jgi:hypothetical protein
MGALFDTTRLVQKYPLTFLAVSAVAAVALPVFSVSTAAALRPWAKWILSNALSVRREAQRVAAESREAYADLLAEISSDSARRAQVEPLSRPVAPAAPVAPVAPAAPAALKPHRIDPAPAEAAAMPAA